MDYIQLNDRTKMPLVGTGTNTFGKVDAEYRGELNGDFTPLETALEVGYRSIDTAISYRNEAGVGHTAANSGVKRSEVFLTTKIPTDDQYTISEDAVHQTIEQSLDHFETDYLDLYLVHHPFDSVKRLKLVWSVLEEYYEKGILKSIGVSNFTEAMIEEMKSFAKVMPEVNQIQSNPTEWNDDLIAYLQKENIAVTAWSPLKAEKAQRQQLAEIGQRYNKSWTQVLLRYHVQRGVVVIPKSHNREHQVDNLAIFDFELSSEDKAKIKAL